MKYRFTPEELKDLVISWIALAIIFSVRSGLGAFILILPTLGVAFILHELGHKFVAQNYGFWAEYRMDFGNLIFAFFLAIFIGIIFAAPGAVMIFPINAQGRRATRDELGRISLAGPMTNLALASIFGITQLLYGGLLGAIASIGFFVNSFLAFFNLLPFGVLDGAKIYRWDRRIWTAAMGLAVLALIMS